MLSRFFMLHIRRTRTHVHVYLMRDHTWRTVYASSRPSRRSNFDTQVTEMQLQKYDTFHPPPPAFYFSTPYLCPRRVCQQYLSPNISLCYPHHGKWATKRFFFFFFCFVCKSATRSPIEEKVMTSRLIVESTSECIYTDHSLANKMSERPVSANI